MHSAERVRLFLEKSAIRYGVAPGTLQWNTYERDLPERGELAARLLESHPEIAHDSLHTAVAAHDIESVRAFLAKDPSLANQRGGPDGWPPLLRLAYTRLPIEAVTQNAVAVAAALLDSGADPRAAWSDGENSFTVLTGVIGGGEGGQPPHPQAEGLARLLLARGADPYDFQAFYNTSLGEDSSFWLDLLWRESEKRGETAKWTAVAAGDSNAVSALDYLLGNAVPNHPQRVRWLLEHGAHATVHNVYSKELVIKHAVLSGRREIIDLLVRHGAKLPELSGGEAFIAAAMQGDEEKLRHLVDGHPEYLRRSHAMFAAIEAKRLDIAALLLGLGMPPDVQDFRGQTALHLTVHCGAGEIAKLLIARGANVDPVERSYNSTPLGHATYLGRTQMVSILAPLSRDIRGLCSAGAVERLKVLFESDRTLASTVTRGEVPLFCLPNEDERAVEVVELLLSFGADPKARNGEGLTPDETAMKRGLEKAAAAICRGCL